MEVAKLDKTAKIKNFVNVASARKSRDILVLSMDKKLNGWCQWGNSIVLGVHVHRGPMTRNKRTGA